MVFFNCNACGEAVKKNQVEKHYQQQCRQCEVLSCVDCGKEFWGDDYQKHIKCITEDEKFGGKSYKPNPNANKGEQKQELWVKQVQDAISKVKANSKLKNLLERLKEHPNIPRKQSKFENFLRNSLRIMDHALATQAWTAISAELNNKVNKEDGSLLGTKREEIVAEEETMTTASENGKNKTKKKGKKKKQKLDAMENETQTAELEKNGKSEVVLEDRNDIPKKKKSKKRKVEDEGVDVEENKEEKIEKPKNKKKRKQEPEENNDDAMMEVAAVGKFKWEAAIIGVLKRADDKEMSVKKLKKKVLAEYHARGGDGKSYTEEKLMAKFTKKINNNPRLKVLKENVKLMS